VTRACFQNASEIVRTFPSGAKARIFRSSIGTAEEAAEKLGSVTSAAKAFVHLTALTAALKAPRHPQSSFSAASESRALPQNHL